MKELDLKHVTVCIFVSEQIYYFLTRLPGSAAKLELWLIWHPADSLLGRRGEQTQHVC